MDGLGTLEGNLDEGLEPNVAWTGLEPWEDM